MGARYLADTNAVIDYLENKLPEKATAFMDNLDMQLSVISRIELLSWSRISPQQLNQLSGFIYASQIYNLSEEIIQNTINIRKLNKIKLPDAVIAATAVAHHLTLITRNTTDFNKIEKLELINPWEIS